MTVTLTTIVDYIFVKPIFTRYSQYIWRFSWLLIVSPSMLEAMQVYSPADSRRTPYVGRTHGDDGDDDLDDAANT